MKPTSWEQAKDVITEALKRAPSERERFVRERCSDSELASEIITLLAAYRDGADFLADPPATDTAEDDDLEPGTRVGPYVIIDSIGRGGMGHVFLGSDPRLRRKVALKCVIKSLAGSGERRLRILHEARAAARITHPNVATIHDVVEHDNRAFIVMEYVEGESLAARLKRERLPIDRVVAIGRQLASALAAAHAKGVVHRDLKPGNVHFAMDGSVKVLDFGIANAPRLATTFASGASTVEPSLQATTRGPHAGTPPYMSPEQLMGGPIDERSDVYSLGVVLFEMATGRRPFRETDAEDLMMTLPKGAPRADEIDARVPPPLAEVIARALVPDPAARFQSAAELGEALQAIEHELHPRTEPIARRVARALVASIATLLMVGALGVVNSAVYNLVLGRTGGFVTDSIFTYIRWGALSLTAPTILIVAVAVFGWVVVAMARLILRMASLETSTARLRAALARSPLGAFRESVVLAQVVAVIGTLVLGAILWRYAPLIQSWFSYVDTSPSQSFAALNPENRLQLQFRFWLAVLSALLVGSIALIVRLRARERATEGRSGLYAVGALFAIVVLLNNAPYRVFWNSKFERVDFAGNRCHPTGEDGSRLLLYCPALPAPRNRVVQRSDPRLRFTGIAENIFSTPHRDDHP